MYKPENASEYLKMKLANNTSFFLFSSCDNCSDSPPTHPSPAPLGVLDFLLNEADERVGAALQLGRGAALEEPVELEAPGLANLGLHLVPRAVPQLVDLREGGYEKDST
jgi:hypothetical protein